MNPKPQHSEPFTGYLGLGAWSRETVYIGMHKNEIFEVTPDPMKSRGLYKKEAIANQGSCASPVTIFW